MLAQYRAVNNAASATAQTPFQTYGTSGTSVAPDYSTGNTGTFVAPVNSQQTTGIANTNAAANQAQPYYQAATGVLGSAQAATQPVNNAALQQTAANSSGLSSSQINQYLSPYLSDVVGSESALLNQNNQQQQAGQLGTAISSGAFGGDRTGLAAANLEQQQNLSNANIYSNLLNSGYQSALGAAQQEQSLGLQGAQQEANIGSTAYGEGANTSSALANLGSGAQSAALQGANAQIAAGTVEQQTQQAQDTAQYNQFEQKQSYPFQVDQFLANIAEGTGALSGSTTTTTQPGGFFSDKRLKHDIKKVGKTFDDQDIYSYKIHGDPRTHIGLIAQEVEKKHPESVGLLSGYRTVDYGKATEDAANRGHFANGGGSYSGPLPYRYPLPSTSHKIDDAGNVIPPKEYHIWDTHNRWIVGKAKTRKSANRVIDRRDAEYGGTKHIAVPIYDDSPACYDSGGMVRRAYAGGGPSVVDPSDLAAILQAQSSMYAPYSGGAGLYGATSSAPHGGTARVPAPSGATPHLVTASGGLKPQPTAMENAKQVSDMANSWTQLYNNFNKKQSNQPSTSNGNAPEPAATPGDNSQARGGRIGYDTGGSPGDLSAVLEAQRAMYQQKQKQQNYQSSGNTPGLAVAQGLVQSQPSGSSDTQQALSAANNALQTYKRFAKPSPKNNAPTTSQTDAPMQPTPTIDYSQDLGQVPSSDAPIDVGDVPSEAPAAEDGAADLGSDGVSDLAGTGAADVAGGAAGDVADGAAADVAGGAAADVGAGAAADAAGVAAADAAAAAAPEVIADVAPLVLAARRGGLMRAKYDSGGMPYQADSAGSPYSSSGFDIPDQQNTNKLQTAGALQKIPTGFQDMIAMGNIANTGSMIGSTFSNEATARGGRIRPGLRGGYDTGGGADNPDPDLDTLRGLGGKLFGDFGYAATGPTPLDRLLKNPDMGGQDFGASSGNDWYDGNADMGGKGFGVAKPDDWDLSNTDMGGRDFGNAGKPDWNLPKRTKQSPPPSTPSSGLGAVDQITDRAPTSVPQPGLVPVRYDPGNVPSANAPAPTLWDRIKQSALAKPENFVPLLSAIGAMGTAPTKHLGVALASGLQAGANSYFPAQQGAADVQQTQATTQNIGARTQGQNISNIAELQKQYALRGMGLYVDPNGPIIGPNGTRYVAKPLTNSMGAAQPDTSAPSQYKYLGRNGMDAARTEGQGYTLAPQEAQNASQSQINDIYKAGSEAQSRMPTLQAWEKSMAANPEGWLTQGALQPIRLQAVNLFNSAMEQIGHPEWKVNGLADAQIADKTSRGVAAMSEAQNQQKSVQALQAFMQMTPNQSMDRDAALRLIANMHMENQQNIDKKNYMDEFDKETQRNYGPLPRNYLASDAMQAFDRDYPANNYEGEANTLYSMIRNPAYQKLVDQLQNSTGEKKEKLLNAIDKKWNSPNLHRYFSGSY